uniref:CUE domain-containing protein n=1 Tax=Hyaloperonospora arabidopsidis (strain Emoy2) TaxID=559515 RepID=M4BCM0_HYAAE
MTPHDKASIASELLTYLSSDQLPPLLNCLDDFLTQATERQVHVDVIDSDSRDASQGPSDKALADDFDALELLVRRLADATPALQQRAVDCELLHVSRLVPLCQVLSVNNARAVAALLDALVQNVAAFSTTLTDVQQLYCAQLHDVYSGTLQVKGLNQDHVVDHLIRRGYELSLSINGLTTATSITKLLLLESPDFLTELSITNQSLLYKLVQCYEVVMPTFHRQFLTRSLGDRKEMQPRLLMIAKTRETLLQVLGRCVDVMLNETESVDAEKLLAGLHALSDCCADEDENAEHGSLLSDLWFLCGYKRKVADYFQRCQFDPEHSSYLDMLMEGLPRRRVLPKLLVDDLAAEAKLKTTLSKDSKAAEAGDVCKEKSSGILPSGEPEPELASMIHQVREFFPDLGEGYVELCLLSSNLQVEAVVDFLLERNPPPILLDVFQDLKRTDVEFTRLKAQITGKPVPALKVDHSKMLHPSQVWVGKKKMEKTYDPQSVKKDEQLYEKMKELVVMYDDEDDDSSGDEDRVDNAVGTLDEYDDDYNDEFDDFVPFTIRDGGSADDQDTIREQNRKIRAKEEKEAFWEGMKNRNRESAQISTDDSKRGDDGEQAKKLGEQKAPGKSSGVPQLSSDSTHKSARHKSNKPGGETGPSEALTPQQIQRQRARKDKNKAKIANHNRKDRAMKKTG